MFNPEYSLTTDKYKVHSMMLDNLTFKHGRIFSLSATSQSFEIEAIAKGFYIHTVECIKKVFKQQRKLWKGIKGITNYYGKADTFLVNRNNYYDLAWLDFCSEFSRGIHTALVNVKADVVGLTVMMRREKYLNHLFKDLGRDEAYNLIFKSLGYVISDKHEYHSAKGSPMCTFILIKHTQLC